MNAFMKALRKNSVCIISAFLILIASLITIALLSNHHFFSASSDTSDGLRYLTASEKADPSTADNFLREKKKSLAATGYTTKEIAAIKDDILNDRSDVFSLFKDYVILGDSRALGFSHYKYLDYSRVLAGGGDTILKVRERMDKIKNLDPSYIYLCYGVNDAGRNIGETPEGYADEVLAVIQELEKALPDAKIYYSSIIWISDQAAINFPPWAKIYDYNVTCKTMCTDNNIRYIDNEAICAKLKEEKMWSGDGIHLSKSFYKLWAQNLYLATLEG